MMHMCVHCTHLSSLSAYYFSVYLFCLLIIYLLFIFLHIFSLLVTFLFSCVICLEEQFGYVKPWPLWHSSSAFNVMVALTRSSHL